MSAQRFLYAAVAFQVVASIIFSVAGLVDVVALVTTALFLTFVLILMLNARARQGES
jgi:hypothetical protein